MDYFDNIVDAKRKFYSKKNLRELFNTIKEHPFLQKYINYQTFMKTVSNWSGSNEEPMRPLDEHIMYLNTKFTNYLLDIFIPSPSEMELGHERKDQINFAAEFAKRAKYTAARGQTRQPRPYDFKGGMDDLLAAGNEEGCILYRDPYAPAKLVG